MKRKILYLIAKYRNMCKLTFTCNVLKTAVLEN